MLLIFGAIQFDYLLYMRDNLGTGSASEWRRYIWWRLLSLADPTLRMTPDISFQCKNSFDFKILNLINMQPFV